MPFICYVHENEATLHSEENKTGIKQNKLTDK